MSQFPPRAFLRMAAEPESAAPRSGGPEPARAPAREDLRFLSLRDVLDRLTISRSLLYELIRDPILPFPSPVHIGRRSVWVRSEVECYMSQVIEASRRRLRQQLSETLPAAPGASRAADTRRQCGARTAPSAADRPR